MNKLFILLIGILFLAACTTTPTLEPNVPPSIEERVIEETTPEEPILLPTYEDLYGRLLAENQSLIQKGVAVDLRGVYYNTSEQKIYFVITGEDRYDNLEAREPLNWHATFYFTKNEHINLFLCDFSKEGEKTWTTIYCDEAKNIPENWYGQKTWIVYTLKEPNILTQRASILEIMREEDTFAFKVNIPKP
ncbi:MAG: hypothetical protein Q7R96_03645 [Nanoarchaeota archaeon]|nr:hypothetical protein [Nanoarchaeota archaeon]